MISAFACVWSQNVRYMTIFCKDKNAMGGPSLEIIDECTESTFPKPLPDAVEARPKEEPQQPPMAVVADNESAPQTATLTVLDTVRDVMIINDPIAPVWGLEDFEIGRKLGEGQFGAVYLARERRTGYLVAIKAIKKVQLLHTSNEHLLRREIEIHSHLIHPNILGFYGWFTTMNYICLIVEIAPRGELMDQLRDGGLPEPVVSRYMMQMISAIRTCHRLNIMHRDLKPENVLMDLKGNLKLADFGWAAHVPEADSTAMDVSSLPLSAARKAAEASAKQRADANPNYGYLKTRRKTYCGTLDYLSPEICRHEWYGKEVDLWCLGILCYELITGGPPFSHDTYREKGQTEEEARRLQQIDIQNSDISIRLKSYMSNEVKDFLLKTLDKDPCQRLTTEQMIRHPFITRYNDIKNELELERLFQENRSKTGPMGGGRSRPLDVTCGGGYLPPSNTIATPDPNGRDHQAQKRPGWLNSRLYISAASSPHSGNIRKNQILQSMADNNGAAVQPNNTEQLRNIPQMNQTNQPTDLESTNNIGLPNQCGAELFKVNDGVRDRHPTPPPAIFKSADSVLAAGGAVVGP